MGGACLRSSQFVLQAAVSSCCARSSDNSNLVCSHMDGAMHNWELSLPAEWRCPCWPHQATRVRWPARGLLGVQTVPNGNTAAQPHNWRRDWQRETGCETLLLSQAKQQLQKELSWATNMLADKMLCSDSLWGADAMHLVPSSGAPQLGKRTTSA